MRTTIPRDLRRLNLCALRRERAQHSAAIQAAMHDGTYTTAMIVRSVQIGDAIERAQRGFLPMKHDEVDDLIEDLQLIEHWLDDLDGAVRGAIPRDSLARAAKYTRQIRRRLLSRNHHDVNDMFDRSERVRLANRVAP